MSEGSSFHRVISEHLALAERNRRLEPRLPLERYREQYGSGTHDDPPTAGEPAPPEMRSPAREEPLRRDPESWRDPDSWWDGSGERPPPTFDWGDD